MVCVPWLKQKGSSPAWTDGGGEKENRFYLFIYLVRLSYFVFHHHHSLTFHSPPTTWTPGLRRKWRKRWSCLPLWPLLWPGRICLFLEGQTEGSLSREFASLHKINKQIYTCKNKAKTCTYSLQFQCQ